MPDNKFVSVTYKKLLSDITELFESARRALVTAYWEIGKRIVEVEQQGAVKAAYGAGLLQKLSEDLTRECGQGFSKRNLERMRAFYLTYPKTTTSSQLDWSHFVELLSVQDRKERIRLEKRVIEEELSIKETRELIRHETVREQVAKSLSADPEEKEPPQLLTPQRGTLYAYRIIRPKLVGAGESELLIDLGFSCTKDLDDITSRGIKEGDIVQSAKTADGTCRLSESRGTSPESLFTYSAEVERVVDGDTLRVIVDLGFGFKIRQYLRLRGIDCPEIDTPEGKKAAEFVRSRIKQADQIVLTSSKSDKYDRYLADVYFTDPDGKERYLNNLLLEHGFAINVEENVRLSVYYAPSNRAYAP